MGIFSATFRISASGVELKDEEKLIISERDISEIKEVVDTDGDEGYAVICRGGFWVVLKKSETEEEDGVEISRVGSYKDPFKKRRGNVLKKWGGIFFKKLREDKPFRDGTLKRLYESCRYAKEMFERFENSDYDTTVLSLVPIGLANELPSSPIEYLRDVARECSGRKHKFDIDSLLRYWIRRRIEESEESEECLLETIQELEGEFRDVNSLNELCFYSAKLYPAGKIGFDDEPLARRNARYNILRTGCLSMDTEIKSNIVSYMGNFGNAAMARGRKYILATSKPRKLESSDFVPDVIIMSAYDLKLYAEDASAEDKLIFEPGHPVDNTLYVQDPFRPNYYYDVDRYHAHVLESKHGELMSLLKSLGAKSVKLNVVNSSERSFSQNTKTHGDATASYKVFNASGKLDRKTREGEQESLYRKLAEEAAFTVVEKPKLPENLVYYPHEPKWQRLAGDVLKGGVQKTSVTLEMKHDSSVNIKRVTDIVADVKAFISGVTVNVNKELEISIRELTSLVWEYEVEFAPADSLPVQTASLSAVPETPAAEAAPAPIAAPQPTDVLARAEELLKKRALRYLKNDGKIDAIEEADLRTLAERHGISEIRLDEIIEEVYDEA